jgi:hypothetical protein
MFHKYVLTRFISIGNLYSFAFNINSELFELVGNDIVHIDGLVDTFTC